MRLIKDFFSIFFKFVRLLAKNFFIFLISLYQQIISPFLGQNCRFLPTCSQYSKEAINKYGIIYGIVLSIKRISKCHPWGKSRYDPVE